MIKIRLNPIDAKIRIDRVKTRGLLRLGISEPWS